MYTNIQIHISIYTYFVDFLDCRNLVSCKKLHIGDFMSDLSKRLESFDGSNDIDDDINNSSTYVRTGSIKKDIDKICPYIDECWYRQSC
jgi:hypothetical protein